MPHRCFVDPNKMPGEEDDITFLNERFHTVAHNFNSYDPCCWQVFRCRDVVETLALRIGVDQLDLSACPNLTRHGNGAFIHKERAGSDV